MREIAHEDQIVSQLKILNEKMQLSNEIAYQMLIHELSKPGRGYARSDTEEAMLDNLKTILIDQR